MRVLIAEDEFIERKAMKKLITENFTGIKVVGEAENGRKAVEQSQLLQPDIIFMDIKMPGIDGLEAIKQIYEYDPTIKFIMISAYDSFDYAKQAMSFGIKDYILKPATNEEIARVLTRMKNDIDVERREQKEIQQSEEWLKERMVTRIIRGTLDTDVFAMKKRLFPTMKSGFFTVMMTDMAYDIAHIKLSIEKIMPYPFVLLENDSHLKLCVFASDVLKNGDVLPLMKKVYDNLRMEMFIGIGNVYRDLSKLATSYHEAYKACFQLKTNNLRKYGYLQTSHQSMDDIVNQISSYIEEGNRDKAIMHYKQNEHKFQTTDHENLYIKVKELLDNYHLSTSESSILTINSAQDWHHFINVSAMNINAYFQSRQHMAQAENYILHHYHQAITLEDVATSIRLSPNYFSSLFKKEFGVTFTEYVMNIRLNKAKELIRDNRHSLKEISFKIGYHDPNYFSRVFKKHFNQSPKRYQKEIFKK